jgi:hypothetical protein
LKFVGADKLCHSTIIAKNGLGAVAQFGVAARGEGRVRERHVHASWAAGDFDLCIELLRERLDEGCAQAALRRIGGGIRLSDPIVGHGKLPVRSVDLVADDDLTVWFIFGKREPV